MKKLLFLIYLFLLPDFLEAKEIKLSCAIDFVQEFSGESIKQNEIVKKQKFHEILTITESKNSNDITIDSFSGKLINVSTYVDNKNVTTKDWSSQNIWHIIQTSKKHYVFYKISRDTGLISYEAKFTSIPNEHELNSATGICEEISSAKRKF